MTPGPGTVMREVVPPRPGETGAMVNVFDGVAAGLVPPLLVPVPLRVALCVPSLVATESDAVAAPARVGANATVTVHDPRGVIRAPAVQVLAPESLAQRVRDAAAAALQAYEICGDEAGDEPGG